MVEQINWVLSELSVGVHKTVNRIGPTCISLLISKSFVGVKQSVISVALKTPLKTRLGICIYKT